MQNLPVYLYQNNIDVILDLDLTTRGVNQVMYQRDLKIQKGLKNQVRIQFKNSDQKRINISSSATYVFSMFDAVNQRQIVEKPLEILDVGTTSTRGTALLTLTESETIDLNKSSYQFIIKHLDQDGSYVPTYANTYYGIAGTLHVLTDSYPTLQPTTEVVELQESYNAETTLYEYKSRAVYANPEYNGNQALHTVAFYMTGFRGTVHIQGSLNNQADYLNKYATLDSRVYTGFTGVDYVNFNGVYSYIQILVIPEKGPLDLDNKDNQNYRGTFDKFLYRS